MNQLAPLGPIYQAGTLSGNSLAMSAGIALLSTLIKENPFQDLENASNHLLSSMKNMFKEKGMPFSSATMGGMFGFFFSSTLPKNYKEVSQTDENLFKKFFISALNHGIYFAPSKYESGFISTAHNQEILEIALEKLDLAIKEI